MVELTRVNERASLLVFEDTGHARPAHAEKPILFDTVPGYELGAPTCEPLLIHTRSVHDDGDVLQTRKSVISTLGTDTEQKTFQVRCQMPQVCRSDFDNRVNIFDLQVDTAVIFAI